MALKAQEKAKKDAELAAKALAQAASGTGNTKVVDPVDPSEYYNTRIQMIEKRRNAGENPFPHKFHVSISLIDFIKKYDVLITEKGVVKEDETVSVAGYFYFQI